MSGAHHPLFGLDGRRRAFDETDAIPGHDHRCDERLADGQRTAEELILDVLDQALLATGRDDVGELAGGVALGDLVGSGDAHEVQQPVGQGVEDADGRAEDLQVDAVGQLEHHGRALGTGDGDVLGHHLAQDHVQEHHDDQAQREAHRGGHRLGHVAVQHALEGVGDGRLGDVAQQQRADRDPQLRTGQLLGQVADGVQGATGGPVALVGHGLELGAPAGHQGELHGDEEPVGQQEDDGDEDDPEAHDAGSLPTAAGAVSRRVTMRSRSISTTSTNQPSWSKPSPAAGTPPQGIEGEAGQGLERPLGHLEAAGVEDLVGVQPAGQDPLPRALHAGEGNRAVVLVGDLADDLLEDVLQRDDPGRAAVLVDDDGQVGGPLLQQGQQRRERQGLGHGQRLGHDVADRRGGPPLERHPERVLHVPDADDVVEVAVVHREAAEPGLDRLGGQRRPRCRPPTGRSSRCGARAHPRPSSPRSARHG